MDLYHSKYTGEEMDALFDKANYVIGMYTGDGNASQFINLGFTPSAVLVTGVNGATYFVQGNNVYIYAGGLALKNYPVKAGANIVVEIVENGFNVFHNTSTANTYIYSNIASDGYSPFRYIAFR